MKLLFILAIYFFDANASVIPRSENVKLSEYNCSKMIDWSPSRNPKVIGGQLPPVGAIPWQIALRNTDNAHQCGAALIGRRLAITAAHCLMENLIAVAGAHGLTGELVNFAVLQL